MKDFSWDAQSEHLAFVRPFFPLNTGLYVRFGKRAFDLALSIAALPILLPLMAVIWCLVRSDGGPAFFQQTRIGRKGEEFVCFKFRSMVVNAEQALLDICNACPATAEEWRHHQKLRHDPRITRFGDFIRKTSLDELPQIFNVLRGDMSLVGPRPFLENQRMIYDLAGGRAYYELRPGVTGLWQVLGRHDTTLSNRARLDEEYGRRMSLVQDLTLIARTIRVVLGCKGM